MKWFAMSFLALGLLCGLSGCESAAPPAKAPPAAPSTPDAGKAADAHETPADDAGAEKDAADTK